MKVEFVLPFINSAMRILEEEGKVKILKKKELLLQSPLKTSQEISVLVAITGTLKGVVLYGMQKEMALKIASYMMGEKVDEFDQLAQSTIAELGNIITGNASVDLEASGYICELSPPTLLIGENTQVSTLDVQRTVVSLATDIGEFEIDIALKEDKENNVDLKTKSKD